MKSITFRWKLTLFIVLICGVSLSLAFAGLFLYDVRQFNGEVQRRIEDTRRLLQENLAPSLLRNPRATDLSLSTAEADSQILAAAVFSTDNKLLEEYIRPGNDEIIPAPRRFSGPFNTQRAEVWAPITSGNQVVGTLYLKAALTEADLDRSNNLLRGSGIIFLAAVFLAFAVAYRLQGLITQPITELARVSADIQRERDYGRHRVNATATGEIGQLIESFNAMLDTIQSNTSELERGKVAAEDARERIRQSNEQLEESNRTLEARVDNRTKLLAKAVKDAEEASKAKSTFLAKMSHELRTPLNAIIGYSEMLQEDARDEGDTRTADDLDKVLSAARHLLGLINDVLDISKIEAGKMELFLESFEITKVIGEVAATISPLIAKRGNTLSLQYAPEIGKMHADATKLRQMLLNLLSNASKFTENGTITLRATRIKGLGSDLIELAIIDTGIGMTPEQLSRLFQAFSQADASTTSKYGGTGLGLAISKQFAQMMQGDITVTSKAGEGSTFMIRMPANVQTGQTKVTPSASNLTRSPFSEEFRARILLIEHDDAIRPTLTGLLHASGYETLEAPTSQQGLDIAAQALPDLIVLDASMPEMDGWAVLTRLQGNPKLAETPVLMLSDVGDTDVALSMGAASVIVKPVDAGRLTAEIAMLLTPLSGAHILLVDDDSDSRILITRMFERENWVFRSAASGKTAVRALQKSRPAVIILDLMMAGMNGFEFLELTEKNPDWSSIPVIIVSSMDITAEMKAKLLPRTLAILQKARYTREELADLIRPALLSSTLAQQ